MSGSGRILRNVVSNWIGFAVNAGVTLLLTPFVLGHLGTSRYGIWILTSSIIGYYGFLDLGFRAGVTQYLTRYLAVGDMEKANGCMSSATAVLGILGLVMAALSVGAAYMAPLWFHLPLELQHEAFWCILIVGCSAAIQCALNPYTSVLTATQRFDLANQIGVLTRLLTAAGIVAALTAGQGLIGVSAVTCAVSVLDYILRWRAARILVPGIVVSLRRASAAQVLDIGTFGAWNSLISVNRFVYQYVPNLLIGWFMPIAAVGHYALATGLIRQVIALLSPVGQVIYPAAAELDARGDRQRLQRLYHDGSRLMLLATSSVVVLTAIWADDFYRLWVGNQFLSGSSLTSVSLLFRILLISVVTSYFSNIASQILIAAGHVRVVATSLLCGSSINILLSLLLVRGYGLAGIATAAVVASIIIDLLAVPFLVQRHLSFSALLFETRACARPTIATLIQIAIVFGVRQYRFPETWSQLAGQGCVSSVAAVIIVGVVGLTAAERERYLKAPFRRQPAGAAVGF